MDYKIIDIEGVGDVYAEKLIAAGINKVSELLAKCGPAKGRRDLAEATGIPEKLILRWTNHADLFRVNGVGPQFAELLEKAGVDTVKEFRHRVPENLQPKLEEINSCCKRNRKNGRRSQRSRANDDILNEKSPQKLRGFLFYCYLIRFPRMSRVSSLVMVRVAALVAFLATRPVVEVRDLVFLPVTLSLT